MTRAFSLAALAALACASWLAYPALAADEGQADLDRATELQLKAENLTDLERVCDLCESALKKGLDEGNKEFATKLLTSTLYDHAARLSNAIFNVEKLFDRRTPHPQWPAVRTAALRDLEKLIEHAPGHSQAHLLVARLEALPNGDKDKALAAAEKAVEHAGEDADQKAKALVVRGILQTDDAKKFADFNAAVEAAPDHADARRARGAYYLTKKDFDKATEDYSKILEDNPDNIEIAGELATALTGEKKFDEALALIEKVIEKNPMAAGGYTARAQIKTLKGDEEGSLADLNKALELDRRDVNALMLRARAYYLKKEYDKAKADIDSALRIRPGMIQGLLMQAELAAQQGNYAEGIQLFQLMAKADPKNVLWKVQLAQLLVADKRPRAAIDVASEVLNSEENNALALRIRGDAYLGIGKHAEAVADLEAALKADPKNSGVLNNLAWVKATSPDDPVRDGKRAIELATAACEATEFKRPHIISTLAAAYAESGDFENAIKWSTKAVEMSEMGDDKPDAEVLEQLKKELEGYKEKKPFRERQETQEKDGEKKEPREDLEI